MHTRLTVFLVLLTVTLAGCETHKAKPAPPPQNVTPGSTFSVIKGFLIPSGDTSVYFQDTRLYPEGGIQKDYPFCQLVTGTTTADGRVMHKETFTVSHVNYDEKGVGPGGTVVSVTEIHLQEKSTGKAYRMNCMLPLLSRDADFVTPAEIQGAVGGYMHLKVAP